MKIGSAQINLEEQNDLLASFNLNGKDCFISQKQTAGDPYEIADTPPGYSYLGEFELDDRVYQVLIKTPVNSYDLTESKHGIDFNLPLSLTDRELQIAILVAKGLLNKQIAHTLSLSVYTVSTHLRRIFTKLGVHNRTALAARIKGQ